MSDITNKPTVDRLVDGLIDSYVDWRDACDRVHEAYRSWSLERGSGERVAFQTYLAALDAEAEAAEVYAASVTVAYERLWGEGPSAKGFRERAGGTKRP